MKPVCRSWIGCNRVQVAGDLDGEGRPDVGHERVADHEQVLGGKETNSEPFTAARRGDEPEARSGDTAGDPLQDQRSA